MEISGKHIIYTNLDQHCEGEHEVLHRIVTLDRP